MANYQIPLSYVVNASVVAGQVGLGQKQLSTILILTDDEIVNAYEGDYMIARNSRVVANAFGTESKITEMVNAIFGQNPNILNNNGYVICAKLGEQETVSQAITKLSSQIYFEGILIAKDVQENEISAASTTVQGLEDKILFIYSNDVNALENGGLFYTLRNNFKTRKLLYLTGANQESMRKNGRLFAAAFASRGLSVNYAGANSTLTMTYKDLAGVPVDTNISEAILQKCEQVGADVFCSIEGLPKVVSFKQGDYYFDELVDDIWLRTTIQMAVANVLFTTHGKIPQTTAGVNSLISAIVRVLNQGVTNGMIAAGEWNSPDTFGVLEDFHRGIRTNGYYYYYTPIYQQPTEERSARRCPVISIAVKRAGAIEHANVMIYIEA